MNKPEHMTCLSGGVLAPKTHERIRFRGFIDTLEAECIEAQVLASGLGEDWYTGRLGEVLDCLRSLLAAEVRESPPPPLTLFGLTEEELHAQSHDVRAAFGMDGHPAPVYTMGPLAARLNTLRARVREGELLAVRTFLKDGAGGWGRDIIRIMNRLSSALYWLFCRSVAPEKSRRGP